MNKEIIEKVYEMIKTIPKEQFRQAMFPTLETKSMFEEFNKFNQKKITTITSYAQGKNKFDSVIEFILRLKNEYSFDPVSEGLYEDIDKKGIIFEDKDKPPITKTEEDVKLLITQMVESELTISAAHASFKIPFHNTIIEDSEKTSQYCKILGIDYDEFMKEFISRGYSIFQLKLVLEKIIKPV